MVEEYGVTNAMMVPTMFSRLLSLPEEVRASFNVSSLRTVVHTGAPCPAHVKERMIEWWGPVLVEVFGATEANGVCVCDSEEWLARPGTVGRPVVGEVVIRDEEGKPSPAGAPGEIWFRGATNFSYFNDEEKTASTRAEGGQMSTVGDVGYVDEEGYLFITDRKIDMVISGGHNIYPREIEDVLSAHPLVEDVGVIGVPNADLGEEVKAVVKPVPGAAADEQLAAQLTAYCQEHLARYKTPRSIDLVEELPRLETGKLAKRFLRERYWAEQEPKAGRV
jgi:long-chain acyl-CoA synthetase